MSWFAKLKLGLSRTSDKLTTGVASVFTDRRLDEAALEELEDLLIMADLGPGAAAELAGNLGKSKFGKNVTAEEVREALAEDIAGMLAPVAVPLEIDTTKRPFIILTIGVNGAGKTTTIGKLAHSLKADGKSVMIAAGDTFRAAAIEQLQEWGKRANVPVVASESGGDAAGLAFEAVQRAQAENIDVLLIDTAGRLHNKSNLMDELRKIVRVIQKLDPTAPHETLLILDATTGQNAHAQVKTFKEMANVTGLALTKLDGTAKGGVIVALARDYDVPLRLVGVGEQVDDMRSFDPKDFARGLMGL
ncbi:MAG: signal recognition particle-docking protein FtsY [Alphaproteobacteria bacterium]|nr:signal recognition particle-docking protein FtsY [Alphaproteobacteria bacterium]